MSQLLIKIQNGTTRGGNLCRTCRHAHVVRGVNNEQFVHCSGGHQMVTIQYEVAECNRFLSAATPTLYEMEEIAWRLITKQGGRSYGFIDAKEFRKREGNSPFPEPPAYS